MARRITIQMIGDDVVVVIEERALDGKISRKVERVPSVEMVPQALESWLEAREGLES